MVYQERVYQENNVNSVIQGGVLNSQLMELSKVAVRKENYVKISTPLCAETLSNQSYVPICNANSHI
jgi:hypothetical protein